MTQRKSETSLNDLPAPKSPDSLDARILAKARAAAPQRDSEASWASWASWNGPWLRGLATTGVLVVAILVAVPGLRTGQVSDDLSETLSKEVSDIEFEGLNMDVQATPAAAPIARAPNAYARSVNKPERREFMEVHAKRSQPDSMEEVVTTGALASAAGDAVAESRDPDANIRSGQSEPETQRLRAQLIKAKPTLKANDLASKETLADAVLACKNLPATKDKALAGADAASQHPYASPEDCYAALKKACGDCTLPPTLPEAIEKLEAQ